ncbi:nucleotidyltransferase domain-containing protein [Aequorivita sp. F47161]|uniref:Nucleotidyltransferase domain-containing protein n=1 Tax=Aequorivita vitellina TaxID=2874475 RepID=A0A9X1U9V9_9FLAO|nr:nucleotidyltransferase domain-containing protein [Aequorivita vitellina]MCG2418986.1 nucleotidyltransferase domain-containing protein [Aequorivita vitellina]
MVKKYPIYSVAIFGAVSRNEQTKDNDLDILLDYIES